MMFEPADGTVVRFTMGYYYHYVAVRQGNHSATTASHDSKSKRHLLPPGYWDISHQEHWSSLARQGATFEVATAWDHVVDNDPRVPKHRKVIRFTVAGLSRCGDFHSQTPRTRFEEHNSHWRPARIGFAGRRHQQLAVEIKRHARDIQVAISWTDLEGTRIGW